MTKRKTIPIKALTDYVNAKLREPNEVISQEQKQALIDVLFRMLVDHDAYQGFQFINNESEFGDDDFFDRVYY